MVQNAFGILARRFRILLSTLGQRPRVVTDIAFTCVVFHNMPRTHQDRVNRVPTPANDVVDYFNHLGALAGQENRNGNVSTNNSGGRSWHLSILFRATINCFQDYPIIPRTFI